jgi:hypothetical protein
MASLAQVHFGHVLSDLVDAINRLGVVDGALGTGCSWERRTVAAAETDLAQQNWSISSLSIGTDIIRASLEKFNLFS